MKEHLTLVEADVFEGEDKFRKIFFFSNRGHVQRWITVMANLM